MDSKAIDWKQDWESARLEARSLDRPLYVDFWEPG